jgi:hypothetical protein
VVHSPNYNNNIKDFEDKASHYNQIVLTTPNIFYLFFWISIFLNQATIKNLLAQIDITLK